jgi:hypothetical protein
MSVSLCIELGSGLWPGFRGKSGWFSISGGFGLCYNLWNFQMFEVAKKGKGQ